MKKIILTAITLLILSGLYEVRAQDKPMPKPAEFQKIASWKGDWEAKITSKMGDQTSTSIDHVSWSMTADGNGMLMKQWMNSPKGGKYQGTHLVGYNMEDKHVHWFLVDNMGQCLDQIVEMAGDNHLRLSNSGKKDGKPTQSTVDLVLKDMNTVDFNQVVMLDGKTVQTMMGTYKRKAAK